MIYVEKLDALRNECVDKIISILDTCPDYKYLYLKNRIHCFLPDESVEHGFINSISKDGYCEIDIEDEGCLWYGLGELELFALACIADHLSDGEYIITDSSFNND